jgi:hypothetical protein
LWGGGGKLLLLLLLLLLLNCNWVSTRWQCSVYKYKKTQTLHKEEKKTIKQNIQYNNKEQKNKKQPYRTKNKHKTSNTNIQDNKITY